ncbi:MAG: hypothetical protein LZF60_270289 [Nitrospira sp.]|nr:MAG: hypothetical protein LZF60_270289 [Nitrospira sp.]
MVGMVGRRGLLLRPVSGCWWDALFSCAKLLKVLFGMRANVLGGGFSCHGRSGDKQSADHSYCHPNAARYQRHGYFSP